MEDLPSKLRLLKKEALNEIKRMKYEPHIRSRVEYWTERYLEKAIEKVSENVKKEREEETTEM